MVSLFLLSTVLVCLIGIHTAKLFDREAANMPHFTVAALLMVTILHSIASVSRPYAHFILATIRVIIFGALSWQTNNTIKALVGGTLATFLAMIPLDVRTALSKLQAEPDTVNYATCPTCCSIYHPDESKPHDPYPHTCTHIETDKPICGTPLVYTSKISSGDQKPPRVIYKPIRPFPYRSFKSYIASLVRRAGVEDLLEKSWNDRPDGTWHDIMDAPAIREFLGPDGRTRYSVTLHGELHLVFSLFVDWFNPLGNKAAGKSHSIGGIYMACLNLPPHLRFRPEYIYLAGIIPGPHEPSVDQLYHFLRPLVDELVEFWHTGVNYARTANRDVGRLVRAAVIPLVCDLPAIRKVAGFSGYQSHHLCSFCMLTLKDISNPDRSQWPRRHSWGEHLRLARQWRDASSEAERTKIFDTHGLRWSELLRLEYWDPTKFVLLDTMHNLFLGELRHHLVNLWGIRDISVKSGNAKMHTPEQQKTQLARVLRALELRSLSALTAIRRDYLVAVAELNSVVERKTKAVKAQLAELLLTWVRLAVVSGSYHG